MDIFPEIPGYKIEQKLGEDKVTKVFLGVQEDFDRKVVIKVFNPILFHDKAIGERFLKEARKTTNFVHPNIANILEAGESGDVHYFVVEYLPESLREKITSWHNSGNDQSGSLEIERGSADFSLESEQKPGEKLEEQKLLKILKELIWGLEYAHKNGYVHKNICPETIRFREDGTPTIVDFFISNIFAPYSRKILKKKGIILDSAHYGSPEQALSKPVDKKGDIYSLGVVFYEMLTGQVPYNAPESIAIENQHIMEPLPQLPDHLNRYQQLLDKMMTKEKEQRSSGGIELVLLIDELTFQLEQKKRKEPDDEKEISSAESAAWEEQAISFTPQIMSDVKKKKSRDDKRNFFQLLLKPAVFVPTAAVIVVIVVVLVILKPFSATHQKKGTEPQDQAQQENATPGKQTSLPTEEQLEQEKKDLLFQHKFQLAKKFFNSGQFQTALEKLEEAETIKSTASSRQLAENINTKILENKDHQAFNNAMAANTIPDVEDYLKQFPSGIHFKEAQEVLNKLIEEKNRHEAERKRILAASTKLRSQYRDLSVKDVRTMLNKYGFFERYYNESGNFKNHFELKTINENNIVVDFATALTWHQSGSERYMNVEKAQQWVTDLNKQKYAGYSDWRLPTLEEAASLIENKESQGDLYIHAVFNREQRFIWTGDTFEESKFWVVDFFGGDMNKVEWRTQAYIRPVRSMK